MNEEKLAPPTSEHYPLRFLLLHGFAIATTCVTFLLLFSGGLVTSKGVGMSVPDWPTTYGYNMFLFPVSRWVGGIFYEHTHRLLASGVGLMTLILSLLLFWQEPRSWVKKMGVFALMGVIAQGILGGLRVTLYKDQIGIFHAILAQSFFSFLVIIVFVTSKKFRKGDFELPISGNQIASSLRWLALLGVILTYFQLGVAATMRHAHLGLSIHDFPTAYGHIFPDISSDSINKINEERLTHGETVTSASQILLQMIHRGGAILLFGTIILLLLRAKELLPSKYWLRSWSFYWVLLLIAQIVLGAWTIWSNKAADIATAHMALGSLSLAISIFITFRLFYLAHTTNHITASLESRTSPNPIKDSLIDVESHTTNSCSNLITQPVLS